MDSWELYELHTACTKGDLLKVQELFKDPEQLTNINSDDKTPLMCAVKSGYLHIVQFLLNKVGDVNFKDSYSTTTLHSACEEGMLHIVRWLLENGADANVEVGYNVKPIHMAFKQENQDKKLETIKLLLSHGANPTLQDCNEDSAISLAYQQGDMVLVKLFKEHKFDVDLYKKHKVQMPNPKTGVCVDRNLLYFVVKGCNKDLISYLVKDGVNFKDSEKIGFDFLGVACSTNNIDFIKFACKTIYNGEIPNDAKKKLIHIAAVESDVSVLKLLIEMGFEYDVLNNYLETPLMVAVIYSRLENAQFLIEKGLKVDECRFDEKTTLHLYCQNNKESGPVFEKMLSISKEINAVDATQRTPLHYAAMEGSNDVIKALIKHGANQKAVDSKKATALHCYSGSANVEWDSEAFKCLVKDVGMEALDEHQKTPLHYAADSAPFEYFEKLVGEGANVEAVSDDKGSVLHHTLEAHYWEKAKLLLEKGVYNDKPNKDGKTPLLCSVRGTELVKMLLDKGANIHAVDNDGQSALHLACQGVKLCSEYTGDIWSPPEEVVQLLLERGCNVNAVDKRGRTPLHLAYDSAKEEVINALLSNGADKKAIDNDGKNILHYAAQCNYADIVQNVFDAGLNLPDKKGHRPLFYAYDLPTLRFLVDNTKDIKPDEFRDFFPVGYEFSVECLEIVFEKGASVKTTNEKGDTMLHHFASISQFEQVKFLVSKGADVNAKNKDLITPLHLSTDHMDLDIIKYFIQHGADISAHDKNKKSVCDHAMENTMRHEPVVFYLTDYYLNN